MRSKSGPCSSGDCDRGTSRVGSGVAVAVLSLLAIGISGCGSNRSVQAFCDTYHEQKTAFIDRYGGSTKLGKDPSLGESFAALANGLASVGDVVVIFDELDKVAPDDIESDVARVRDSIQSQIDGAGGMISDPLGAVAGGLVSGLTSAGSFQRVSDYVSVNCESGKPRNSR